MAEEMVCMWGQIMQEFLKWVVIFFFIVLLPDFRKTGIMTGLRVTLLGHC